MNSPLEVTNSRSRPPQALRDAQLDLVADETDSGVFELFESAILVVASSPDEFRPTFLELARAGFSVIFLADPKSVEELAFLPRFALIETALPGALDLLRRINAPEPVMQVLALLGPTEAEGPALTRRRRADAARSARHRKHRFCACDAFARKTRSCASRGTSSTEIAAAFRRPCSSPCSRPSGTRSKTPWPPLWPASSACASQSWRVAWPRTSAWPRSTTWPSPCVGSAT